MALNKRSEKGSPLTHNEVDANWTQLENWLAGKAPLNHTHSIANVTGLQVALDARMLNSQRGVANGVASLGSDGKVPMSQLPAMSGSSGMYFPHDTLVAGDVDKLVIWKDGKAQLPVFEPAVAAVAPEYSFELNLAGFDDLNKPTATVVYSANPVDGDTLGDWTFKTTPISDKESLIQGTAYDTFQTFIITFNAEEAGKRSIVREDSTTLKITSNEDGRYGYFSFEEDLLSMFVDTSFATVTRTTTTTVDRMNNCLVPFLFLWGIGWFEGENKYDAYIDFYRTITSFTETMYVSGQGVGDYPASLSELKDGIVEWLLKNEDVVSAVWYDEILKIRSFREIQLSVNIESADEDYWYDAINDGTVTDTGANALPPICAYPIIGLVKAVGTTEVEIYTEPICTFKSTHDEAVVWTNLMDLSRCFILDPDNVGYLIPLTSIEFTSLDSVFITASAGYVMAIDKSIGADSTFLGAFSLDLYALQVLYLLSSSGGGDE